MRDIRRAHADDPACPSSLQLFFPRVRKAGANRSGKSYLISRIRVPRSSCEELNSLLVPMQPTAKQDFSVTREKIQLLSWELAEATKILTGAHQARFADQKDCTMTAHNFDVFSQYKPSRLFIGQSKIYLLLDEHCFAEDPEDIFPDPATLFAAIRNHFEGEWVSDASIMHAKVDSIVSQRFDRAHEWWKSGCGLKSDNRDVQATGCWTSALNHAANANLIETIKTDRLCDPTFIAEVRATWHREMVAAAACQSMRLDFARVVTPALMLAALEKGAVPGFAAPDAMFGNSTQVSFDWRDKLAGELGMFNPDHDGHWIIVALRVLPAQKMFDIYSSGPAACSESAKPSIYAPVLEAAKIPAARCGVSILDGSDFARGYLVPLDVAQPGDLVAMVVHHKVNRDEEETQSLAREAFFVRGVTGIVPVSPDKLEGRTRYHAACLAEWGTARSSIPHDTTRRFNMVEDPECYDLAIIVFAEAVVHVNLHWLNNDVIYVNYLKYCCPIVFQMTSTKNNLEGPARRELARRYLQALDQIFPPVEGVPTRHIELPQAEEFVCG